MATDKRKRSVLGVQLFLVVFSFALADPGWHFCFNGDLTLFIYRLTHLVPLRINPVHQPSAGMTAYVFVERHAPV